MERNDKENAHKIEKGCCSTIYYEMVTTNSEILQ